MGTTYFLIAEQPQLMAALCPLEDRRLYWGLGMHKQLAWHRRHALLIASQLPDDPQEARLVMEALSEVFEQFLAQGLDELSEKIGNVLPFASG